jgi:uncharacterized membrane protein
MKSNESGGKAFILFWAVIIALAAIVIGLNKITQSDYGLAILLIPIILIISFIFYRDYRKDLNKKKQEARAQGTKYDKPTVIDDTKTGISILILLIIAGIILIIIYAILHWFAPGIFPSVDVN